MTIDGLAAAIGRLSSKIDTMDSKMSTMDSKMSTMDSKMSGMDSKMSAMDSRIGAMDSRIEAMDLKIGALDSKIDAVDSKVDAVADEMRSGFKRVDEQLNQARVRDEALHSMMKFGLEARDILRDEIGRRFDAADQRFDEQFDLLQAALKSAGR
jgi:SMC interacting uncharacterized protein involved in chromosome segregation